jgi:hypothetical protein
MPRYFLKKVVIEGFRGINNEADPLALSFKSDCVNSVFAYNGGGKSSVFEAVEYAISGRISKLQRLHADEDADAYYANRFHTRRTATIILTLVPDDGTGDVEIRVDRAANGTRSVSSPTHATPEDLLSSLDEELVLLDYQAFQRFVEDKPLDRGRSFAGLLGLARVSEMHQVLQTLANTRNVEADLGFSALTAQLATIEQGVRTADDKGRLAYEALMGRELPATQQLPSVANDVLLHLKAQPTIGALVIDATLDTVDFDGLGAAIAKAEGGAEQKELIDLGPPIQGLKALAETSPNAEHREYESLKALVAKRDTAIQATKGDLFRALFNSVLPVVNVADQKGTKVCPVCGLTADEPIEHIVSRHLEQFAEAATAANEVAAAWTTSAFAKRLSDIEASPLMKVAAATRNYSGIDSRASLGTCTGADIELAWKSLADLEAIRSQLLSTAETRKKELEAKLPASLVQLTTLTQNARTVRDAIRDHSSADTAYTATKRKLDERKAWKAFAEYARLTFSTLETALVNDRTTRIQVQCETIFREIAKVQDIVPALNRVPGREELTLRLHHFHGLTDIAAPAVLSESFRNALAISVFLSAILSTKPKARFVLLDDITSSFDSGHQWWLMEAIRTKVALPGNPDGPQVIILSHDGLLEKYFDTLGNQADWHHTKLVGTSPRGLVFAQSHSSDRLKNAIANHLSHGRVDEAKPIVRQYVEFSLQQIIRKLDIPVPLDFAIRDNNRLVKDCLDAIKEAVALRQAANSLVLTAAQINDLLNVLTPSLISNWVSHYGTTTAVSLTPAALSGVVTAIDSYSACFKYQCGCNGTPQPTWYKSLSRKACAAC